MIESTAISKISPSERASATWRQLFLAVMNQDLQFHVKSIYLFPKTA